MKMKIRPPVVLIATFLLICYASLLIFLRHRGEERTAWASVHFEQAEVTVPGDTVRCVTAVDLRRLFEPDLSANALQFCVKNEKNADGRLVTVVGSAKTKRLLRIDWADNRITDGGPGLYFSDVYLSELAPEQRQPGGREVVAGFRSNKGGSRTLILSVEDSGYRSVVTLNYDCGDATDLACYAPPSIPLAFLPKMENGALAALLVFDVETLSLVGEIVPPVKARTTRPFYALDRENGVIVAGAYDMDWMMFIDCSDYLRQKAQEKTRGN